MNLARPAPFSTVSRWDWLKVLVAGVVAFIILERALISTGVIAYIPSLLLVGTLTVPAAFCLFLYSRAKQPAVPLRALVWCFVWGGIIGTVLAGVLEYHTLIDLKVLPTIAIGVIEEAAKILIPAYFLLRFRLRSELDGIILGAAAGAGFAVLESMGYGLAALFSAHGNIAAVNEVLLFRSLSAPAAHIAWTGLLGGALWNALNRAEWRRFFWTFVGVAVLHSLWDSVDFTLGQVLIGAVSLFWLMSWTHRAQKFSGV